MDTFKKGDVVTMDDFRKEARKREKQKKVNDFAKNVERFIVENKEVIAVVAPIGVGLVAKSAKVLHKNYILKKEKDLKDLYCYDRSLGHYWALKRQLTNAEWVEIDKRKKNGERLADILDEFKVLK